MRYTVLGQSGLRVSEICLGTMTFGTDWGFGATDDVSLRQVDLFAEAGGNFIDTASNYTNGSSEALVGRAVAGDRDYWVVSTKYTLVTGGRGPNAAGNHRKNLAASVEGSLRRLGTDHIDVLYVHAWDDVTPVEEVVRALDDLVRAGKVLYVGLSDVPAWVGGYGQALAHLRGWSPFVALQVPWSLAQREPERELVPMARALGMTVCAWSPLAGGLLSGKYAPGAAADAGPRRLREEPPPRLAIAAAVAEVANEVGAGSSQVALAWLRGRGAPGSVVPVIGARRVEQLADNLRAVDLVLSEDHVERLERAAPAALGFPRQFLDAMTGIIHGPGVRETLDVPPGPRRA